MRMTQKQIVEKLGAPQCDLSAALKDVDYIRDNKQRGKGNPKLYDVVDAAAAIEAAYYYRAEKYKNKYNEMIEIMNAAIKLRKQYGGNKND